MRSFARRVSVVIYVTVAACQGDKPLAPSADASSIAAGPLTGPSRLILPSPPEGSSTSVFVGDSIQLSSNLSTKRHNTITWSSSSSTVARVTNKGLVVAADVGSATITASNSTGTEHWSFTVAKRIASITVTPNPVSVAIGANVTLVVTLKASDGSVLTGRPISYQSLNTSLATVSTSGVVTGVSNGTTSVVVTAGTTNNIVTSTVPVAVGTTSPPPDTGALGLNAALTRALFPPDNPWNTPIDTASVDPNSAAIISNIGLTTSFHPDFGANYNGGPFGIPYVVVSGTQARVNVTFDYSDESDPGPYPIPPNPPIEPGSDAHVLVVDRDNWKLYELFAAQRLADGSWHAGSGAIFDLSSNAVRPAGWTSADAAGLPIVPGLVRFDEVSAGNISHALRFTVSRTRRAYVYPARHWASSDTSSLRPPMGMRVRLKAGVNISGFPASAQVILLALKKYGMIVADNGSNWFVSGTADARWNDTEINTLKALKGSDFEVVRMTGIVTP
jgi:Bacterial Ig-like domain (group 2)